MQEIQNESYSRMNENEINLGDILFILLQRKWTVISISSLISILGVIYSLYLPNIYESKAILVPVSASNNISSSLQGYSGLAGLAGISLPSAASSETNHIKAINKLSTLSFFENNVLPNIFLPNLMAFKSWDSRENIISYDKNIYNNNSWVREVSYPNKQIPSAQESFSVFKNKHININEDKKNGLVTLTIRHQSPFIAKQWAELIISEVNTFYRQKDKLESQRAVIYLNEQMAFTNLSEIKQVIAQILQKETQKLALIEAKQSYVFDYIDPPAVMEQKSQPQRSLICILSAIFGGFVGIFVALIKHYIYRKKVI